MKNDDSDECNDDDDDSDDCDNGDGDDEDRRFTVVEVFAPLLLLSNLHSVRSNKDDQMMIKIIKRIIVISMMTSVTTMSTVH